jgi:hypothetical protein
MTNISLEMAEAYNKTRRTINSCHNLDQLSVAREMLHSFERLFQSKKTKRFDKEKASEFFGALERLSTILLERTIALTR